MSNFYSLKKTGIGATIFSLAWLVPHNAYAIPCATSEGGQRSLTIPPESAPTVWPWDLLNNAEGAWREIASTIQDLYGCSVSGDGGMITVTATVSVMGIGTYYLGNFPMDYDGSVSIEQGILGFMGMAEGADPNPCDPNENCCAECASGFIGVPSRKNTSGLVLDGDLLDSSDDAGGGSRRLYV